MAASGYTKIGDEELGDKSHDHGHEHSSGHDHGHSHAEEVKAEPAGHGHDHSHDHKPAAPTGGHDHSHEHNLATGGHGGHDHSHDHDEKPKAKEDDHESSRPLYIAMCLCFIFMLVELVGGLMGHSLAIITDALHMLTDVFSFALAIYASIISKQASTRSFTFGFKRAEVLSALISTLLIWVLTAVLMYEAVIRIIQYNEGKMRDVDGRLMFFIAIIGVGFNLVLERVLGDSGHGHSHGGHSHGHAHGGHHNEAPPTASTELVHHGHDHSHGDHDHAAHGYGSVETNAAPAPPPRNLNIDAAYLHVIGDLIQSVGVAVAGLLIWQDPSWKIADPLCTIGFGCLVMLTTFSMLWSNVTVLLEGVPDDVDIDHIEDQFMNIKDKEGNNLVTDVHDLHIWSMSSGSHIITAHVTHVPAITSPDVLARIHAVCLKNGIAHATIQVLPEGSPCTSGVCCV